jgi:hypothetical protein
MTIRKDRNGKPYTVSGRYKASSPKKNRISGNLYSRRQKHEPNTS